MIVESPLLKEILEDVRQGSRREGLQEGWQGGHHDLILRLLAKRFGPVPDQLVERVRGVRDESRLQQLFDLADDCRDLTAFEAGSR